MGILGWIGLVMGVLVFAFLFDHFFGFIFSLLRKITGKKKSFTVEDWRKVIDKL